MASGLQSNSEPIEPDQVWTREEWDREQPWGAMNQGPLRRRFKEEGFRVMYGGPRDLLDFSSIEVPLIKPGDRVHIHLKNGEVIEFDVEA